MALDFVVQLADKSNASIALFHAVDFPIPLDAIYLDPTTAQDIMDRSYQGAEENLQKICRRFEKTNVEVDYMINSGNLTNLIKSYLDEFHFDLIIMGTHGASGVKEIIMGSNAEKIIRSAKCPVCIVPVQQSIRKLSRLLVPVNIEDLSDGYLHHLKELQHLLDAELHFLFVNTPGGYENERRFNDELTEILAHREFPQYEIHTTRDFNPESGIFHFASDLHADIICMSTHGRIGLAHLFEGSLTEDIANHSKIPVWTYNLKMDEHFEELDNLAF
jgi:nucleotide-binding universal stress UspA family protein